MPWERHWINTSGFPPGHPLYRDAGFWRDVYRSGPEDFPEQMEEARTIAEALRSTSNPDEVAELLGRARSVRSRVHWAAVPSEPVRVAWHRLVERNTVGSPTHDIVELDISGKNTRVRFAEVSRRQAWRAPDAGRFDETLVDLWVTPDGDAWSPYNPHRKDGGGASTFERDIRGRVFGPKPLWLAVSAGSRVQTRTTGMYFERHLDLLHAVVLGGPGNPVGVHTPYVSGGLADAALAVLTRSR